MLSQVFPDLPVPHRVLLEEGIRQGEMPNHFKAGGGEAEVAGYMARGSRFDVLGLLACWGLTYWWRARAHITNNTDNRC